MYFFIKCIAVISKEFYLMKFAHWSYHGRIFTTGLLRDSLEEGRYLRHRKEITSRSAFLSVKGKVSGDQNNGQETSCQNWPVSYRQGRHINLRFFSAECVCNQMETLFTSSCPIPLSIPRSGMPTKKRTPPTSCTRLETSYDVIFWCRVTSKFI